MFIDYTSEELAFQKEIRDYLDDLITPELEAELSVTEGGGPQYHKALQQLGKDGWLGIAWPKKFGGQERSSIDEFIFYTEVQRRSFPIPFLMLCTVGPTLMKFGSDEQRQKFLPDILAGKVHFSIGYTEPNSGTDLASLKTKAIREGDHYVVNGQKVFCSLAEYADWIWLAVRTDPNSQKHAGISILLVDINTPGLDITPIRTLGDNLVSAVYLNDVKVPVENLVGKEGEGWRLITSQLNHERIALMSIGPVNWFLQETRDWAANTKLPDGSSVLDLPWVQQTLAEIYSDYYALRIMHWQQAWKITQRSLNPAEASAVKVFGSEFYVRCYRQFMQILGAAGAIKENSPGALLSGRIEKYYRSILVLTFGGGTNEVQRDIISMMGLGMPRAPYGV